MGEESEGRLDLISTLAEGQNREDLERKNIQVLSRPYTTVICSVDKLGQFGQFLSEEDP